jgi:hypothetical protein
MTTESILGLPAIEHDPLEFIEALGEGFPVKTLPYFKRAARLSDSEFARLLGMSGRSLTRLKSARAGRQQVRSLLLRMEHAQLA